MAQAEHCGAREWEQLHVGVDDRHVGVNALVLGTICCPRGTVRCLQFGNG